MCPCITLTAGRALGLAALMMLSEPGPTAELPDYPFSAAAQEITQLFWLADTAAVCGWASEDESNRFKHFSVRFLAAHLSGPYKGALQSMVSEPRYETSIRKAALDGASTNCESHRWHAGWITFKAAADEHEAHY